MANGSHKKHGSSATESEQETATTSLNGKFIKPAKPPVAGTSSVKEILAWDKSLPVRFRVMARVVSFWPSDLRDCAILHCFQCKKECVGLCYSPYQHADIFTAFPKTVVFALHATII